MGAIKLYIVSSLITLCMALPCMAQAELLQLHLPRTASIKGEMVKLGAIGVLSGSESLAATAKEVCMGKIPGAGHEITIERNTILSRLASSGIVWSKVQITGAESITVKREGYTVSSVDIVKAAHAVLAKNTTQNCQWKPVYSPRDVTIDAEANDVNVVAKVLDGSAQNQKQVRVSVMHRGKEAAFRDVGFGGIFSIKKIIAIADIHAGTPFSAENIRIETVTGTLPQDGYFEPYGYMAKRQIRANTVVTNDMIESSKSAVLVNKSQGVVIQIKQPGLTITVLGEALQDGRAKELIKVRNIDSQKVLLAKVNEDGTVEPVF